MNKLHPLIIIVLGFLLASGISLAGIFLAAYALLKDASLFFGGGRPRTWPEIFTILVGIVLPFVIFPVFAWFLWNNFKDLDTAWFPAALQVVIFASFPVILIGAAILYSGVRDAYTNWHPTNGEQRKYYDTGDLHQIVNWRNGKRNGPSVVYCRDGTAWMKGDYEDGLPVGEHMLRTGCEETAGVSYTFYSPAGKGIEHKKLSNGRLTFQHYKREGQEVLIWYRFDENRNENRIVQEETLVSDTGERITKTFDTNGLVLQESRYIHDKLVEEKGRK